MALIFLARYYNLFSYIIFNSLASLYTYEICLWFSFPVISLTSFGIKSNLLYRMNLVTFTLFLDFEKVNVETNL